MTRKTIVKKSKLLDNKDVSFEYKMLKKHTYIDLFAGCGGISLGLFHAGWHGLFAIEKDKMAFGTLQKNLILKKDHFNWPMWLPQTEHDIKEVMKNYRSELENIKGKVYFRDLRPESFFKEIYKEKKNLQENLKLKEEEKKILLEKAKGLINSLGLPSS